jgi:hypothetical protein
MITIRPGSRVHRLLILLSVAGEYPAHALGLIGSERDMKKFLHRLEDVQDFRADKSETVHTSKLVNISGNRNERTIRLHKGALPILSELHPDALGYYLDTFWGHRFPGDTSHIRRNHRVSEALAMCMAVGIEMRTYILPKLQITGIRRTVPNIPCFYIARDFKKLDVSEFSKTIFTRIIGAAFCQGGIYAVYNTRSSLMKWSGMGEFKASLHLRELVRMNVESDGEISAILLGDSAQMALQTIIESEKTRRLELRFDRIYPHIHFIPLDRNGIRLLRMLILPDWREKMLSQLFSPNMRPHGHGFMEYDAYSNGTYIYSYLDSDIARLIRFREALDGQTEKFEALCFPWQVAFLKEYLGSHVILKQIEMEAIETALGIQSEPPQGGGGKT